MSDNAEVMSLDDAIASGDPDLIGKALEASEFGEQNEAESSDNEPDVKGGSEEGSDNSDAEEAAAAEGNSEESAGDTSDQSESDEVDKVVKSRDGKHEIPYDVLEQSREREREARQRADDLQRQLDEANSKVSETQKQLDNAKSKAEEHGIDAEAMFADPNAITEKDLQELEEDYGKGSAQAKFARNMMKLQQEQAGNVEQADAAEAASDNASAQAATDAFNSNTDLTDWQKNDPDRWDTALTIDKRLQSDPQWKDKSIAERFSEVTKRTKLIFGDQIENSTEKKSVKDRAKEIIDKTDQEVPDSLSDLGQSPAAEKSTAERFEGMSEAQIHEEIDRMSPTEYEEFLNKGFM